MSLILNAKGAISEGGTLTLTTKVDGGRALIACTDSGRGIDPQDMPHVFHAFYTTKDHGLGAGLGLYVCHSIVDEHDGHITIDSNPGDGTTVTVDLAAERVHVMPMSMTVGAGSPRRAQYSGDAQLLSGDEQLHRHASRQRRVRGGREPAGEV